MVLVNHYADTTPASIFKATNNAAMTVNLHIAAGTNNFSWKQNGEIHDRTYWDIAIHREEHAVGGYVLRLRRTGAVLRGHFYRQVQRKARGTLHCRIVLDRSLGFLRVDPLLLLCCFA